jgi:hypothetical protein
MKKDKGKYKREYIWCIRCKLEGRDKDHCPLFHEYLTSGDLSPLKQLLYLGVSYVEIDITLENVITFKNISRHLPTFTSHSINMRGMMRNIVGLMTSCMKYQDTHIKFKEKYNKKEILFSLTPQEEELQPSWWIQRKRRRRRYGSRLRSDHLL